MKKIIILMMFLFGMKQVNAQTAKMVIDNSANPCSVSIILHGMSASLGGGCNGIVSNQFTVPAYTTYTFTNPLDIESSTTYCGGSCSLIGWSAEPTGTGSIYQSLAPHYPTDFKWTYIQFEYLGSCCSPVFGGFLDDLGVNCYGTGSAVHGPGNCTTSSAYGVWTPASGGFLSNRTVTFTP